MRVNEDLLKRLKVGDEKAFEDFVLDLQSSGV